MIWSNNLCNTNSTLVLRILYGEICSQSLAYLVFIVIYLSLLCKLSSMFPSPIILCLGDSLDNSNFSLSFVLFEGQKHTEQGRWNYISNENLMTNHRTLKTLPTWSQRTSEQTETIDREKAFFEFRILSTPLNNAKLILLLVVCIGTKESRDPGVNCHSNVRPREFRKTVPVRRSSRVSWLAPHMSWLVLKYKLFPFSADWNGCRLSKTRLARKTFTPSVCSHALDKKCYRRRDFE